MATILLVEDDRDQLEIRGLVLEAAGHTVRKASNPQAALAQADGAQLAVVDLGIPTAADGEALLQALKERHAQMKLIVMSGWTGDFRRLAVEVDALLEKPYRSQDLLALITRLALLFIAVAAGWGAEFQLDRTGEAIAHLEMSAPGKSWEAAGRESALAKVVVDGKVSNHVMLYNGGLRTAYPVFLGRMSAGTHSIAIEGAGVQVHGVQVKAAPEEMVAHAPVLFERRNAIGRFTDIPLLTYCEERKENGRRVLQYTAIFSNEDGGTSTRSLMARWGRTTDIEYIYRVYLTPSGAAERAIVQGRDHKDVPFTGPYDGTHPLLIPVTDNNMVAGEGPSEVRYQLAPVPADLAASSREEVMDRYPFTWRVMTQELIRERKLRAFGVEEGEKISDPRNYLYIEARVQPNGAATAFAVRLRNGMEYTSHRGRAGDAIERSGWVRSTIELPPGTTASDLVSLRDVCVRLESTPPEARCGPAEIKKLFFLDPVTMSPGASFRLPIGNN
jgi:CheY-like chemotaxis protein